MPKRPEIKNKKKIKTHTQMARNQIQILKRKNRKIIQLLVDHETKM